MTFSPILEDMPRIAFVRSAPVARLLRDLLLDESDPSLDQDTLRRALVDTVFRPRADVLRRDDVDESVGGIWQRAERSDGLYDLGHHRQNGVLAPLAFTKLEHMGGYYEVRPESMEHYCALIRHIDPSFLVAVRHLHHLRTNEWDVSALEAGLNRQSPLAVPAGDPDRPHADNHVHLYGVGITAHPLAGLLFEAVKFKWSEIAFDPALGIDADDCRMLEYLLCATARYVMEFACAGKPGAYASVSDQCEEIMQIRRPIQARLIRDRLGGGNGDEFDIPQRLAFAVAREAAAQNAGAALQLLASLALYLHATVDLAESRLHRSVLAFVHALHLLRSCIVVSGQGLRTFVGYYGNAVRYQGESFVDHDRWKTLLGNGVNMVDAKISTTKMRDFCDYAKETAKATAEIGRPLNPAQHGWQRYHLSYHFIRSRIRRRGARPGLYLELERRNAERTAKKLRAMLKKIVWKEADHPTVGDIRQNVANWIRSFDVAGDETCTPIEVFAPALRWLRDKPIIQVDGLAARVSPRRSFSIHAGEDFSYIVSGLRHLEETVEFCALGHDDRIGHGLALGLDPHEWVGRQGIAIVPLQTHVDNLVWLWHHATQLAHRVEVAGRLLPQLRRRLDIFSHELHRGEPPRPETLYRAWRLRRNCPRRLLQDAADANLTDALYWIPDLVENPSLKDQPEFTEYRRYLIPPSAEGARPPEQQQVRLRFGRAGSSGWEQGDLVDYVGSDELDLIAAVQDRLMTVIDAKGIVIEACPTSNLFIARLPGYEAHPVFRWNPPDLEALAPGGRANRFGLRTGPVSVCLNTDDPAIMPTTILTEHHLMKEAAVRHYGVSRTMAAKWIDGIRSNGVDLFRRAHQHTDLRVSD